MPSCGATFDENSVPPWTRGDFRGVLNGGTNPNLGAAVKASHSLHRLRPEVIS